VLTCESVALSRWGDKSESFRAPFWRLYRNHQRGAAVLFKNEAIELSPDTLYLIPPETDFSPDLRSPVRHFYLHFIARPPFDRAAPGIYGQPAGAERLRRIDALESLMDEPATPETAASFTLHTLALVYDALSGFPSTAMVFRSADIRIERAQAAIRENLRSPWSNTQLAGAAHMTPNAFIRRFRVVAGESPQLYARRQRVERACVLLHTTGDSIEQIAEATGFCDRYHFTRVFTQLRGVSPAAFRKTHAAPRGQAAT
jgi:AraC-like DNA-binding protein